MQQGRWVSYIYRYRSNSKCENAGFIKVQRINQGEIANVRIQTGLRLYKKRACRCRVWLIYNLVKTKPLTEIHFAAEERDTIINRIELPWDNPLGDGMSIEEYDGLFFACDDGELLTGMWKEYQVDVKAVFEHIYDSEKGVGDLEAAAVAADAETIEPDVEAVRADAETAEPETEAVGEEQAPWQYILDTYPKLPLLADSQFIECVKIVPQDIGKLAISNWRLGVNTFVSHGYYHYRYLMLGRVRFEKDECVVIGVPGVFTNKERYLANMFGFDTFIPVKRSSTLTGNFGYWVLEIRKE